MSKPIKIQMDKFPYLSRLKAKVQEIKQDINILNARKPLLEAEIKKQEKTPLEINRLQDEINKLPRKLTALYMDLAQSEDKFKKYNETMISLVSELNNDYDQVYDEAKKEMLKGNEKIKEQFEQYGGYNFEENWEAKVNFYGVMKHLLKEPVKTN